MPRKTFANGFPLPASDLNTYLMDQSVQTYGSAAARTSAIATPIEGQVTYLEDTNLLYVWDGSAWTSVGQIADGSITNAKLANSSVSINGNSVALGASTTLDIGRNKIINGAFDFWQRSDSAVGGGYATADRWSHYNLGSGTTTFSKESTIVPSGSRYSMKVTQAGATGLPILDQGIETLNTVSFAGQVISASVKAAASASTGVTIELAYSTNADNSIPSGSWTVITPTSGGAGTVTTTSSFSTISGVWTIPSTAKTIRYRVYSGALTAGTSLYLAQVQLETGSVVTPFQRAAGTIDGELAACQRYCQVLTATEGRINIPGTMVDSTNFRGILRFPVKMRVAPSMSFSGGWRYIPGGSAATPAASGEESLDSILITSTGFSASAGYSPILQSSDAANGKITLTAEL